MATIYGYVAAIVLFHLTFSFPLGWSVSTILPGHAVCYFATWHTSSHVRIPGSSRLLPWNFALQNSNVITNCNTLGALYWMIGCLNIYFIVKHWVDHALVEATQRDNKLAKMLIDKDELRMKEELFKLLVMITNLEQDSFMHHVFIVKIKIARSKRGE